MLLYILSIYYSVLILSDVLGSPINITPWRFLGRFLLTSIILYPWLFCCVFFRAGSFFMILN